MCHLLLYITASDMRTNYYVSLKKPKKKIDQTTKLSVHKIKYIEIEYRIVTRGITRDKISVIFKRFYTVNILLPQYFTVKHADRNTSHNLVYSVKQFIYN